MKTLNELQPNWKGDLAIQEIVRIDALENYSKLVDNKGRVLVFAYTLGKYETALQLPFLRVNRSCILNLNYVKDAGPTLSLTDGSVVNISRRRKEKVLRALQNFK